MIDEYRFPTSIDRNRYKENVVTSINIDEFPIEIDVDFYRLLSIVIDFVNR